MMNYARGGSGKTTGVPVLNGVVEKPAPEEAPSTLASISRYLLGLDFFDALAVLKPDPITGEYLSITALLDYTPDQSRTRPHDGVRNTTRGLAQAVTTAPPW